MAKLVVFEVLFCLYLAMADYRKLLAVEGFSFSENIGIGIIIE